MSYWRFAAMIATSTIVMFVLMYLNTFAFEHVFWSETRIWMAILMGATMAAIMLSFMLRMYQKKAINIGILAGSIIVFFVTLWLIRSQATVDGNEYMRAMIPHHSIAIMTSARAQITDPRVRKLADGIIAAQRREIAEMKYLIDGPAWTDDEQSSSAPELPPRVVPAREAIDRAAVAKIDPETLTDAEVAMLVKTTSHCTFSYTAEGLPILAGAEGGVGVVKIHGHLVRLSGNEPSGNSATWSADGMRLTIRDGDDANSDFLGRWNAKMIFSIDAGLTVGYAGWYHCDRSA